MAMYNLFAASQVHAPGCECEECSELLLVDVMRDVCRDIAKYVNGSET